MSDGKITWSKKNSIAVLKMLRPAKRNALDLPMLNDLLTACDEIEADESVRALVLTGVEGSFSAGGDIGAWSNMSPQEFGYAWVRFGHRAFERLATIRIPVIAAMNGHGLGGGLEIAGAADIRIAEKQIKIGMPETSLGMVPGWSGTQRLVARFGAQIIRRMVLGGEVFEAEEASKHGLVDLVVEQGQSLDKAISYAARIAARGPAAIEISKLMIAIGSGEDKGSAVDTLGSILAAKTDDLKEGVLAFSEKRAAKFKGKW